MKIVNHKNQFFTIERYQQLSSTSDVVKRRAADGAPSGLVIVADTQTQGRGRYDRRFYSPGKGLYFSVLLRPDAGDTKGAGFYTAASAVAVCKAVEKLGFKPMIKWVNDVYLNGKKVCGILTEGMVKPNGGFSYVVLGIGINTVCPKGGFAPEIQDVATALYHRGGRRKIMKLLKMVLDELHLALTSPQGVLENYCSRSLPKGSAIEVLEGRCQGIATVLGITEDYKLRVRQGENVYELDAGEVKIKI